MIVIAFMINFMIMIAFIVIALQVSWTLALRQIVKNCYRYHGREDLLRSLEPEQKPKSPSLDLRCLDIEYFNIIINGVNDF